MTDFNKYKSDIWIIENNKYLFPEIENKMYNPEGVGISISGGGNRSLVSMMGYIRAMNKLMIDGERIFNKTQFISSISGGSWFVGIYLLGGYYSQFSTTITNQNYCIATTSFKTIKVGNKTTFPFTVIFTTFLGGFTSYASA